MHRTSKVSLLRTVQHRVIGSLAKFISMIMQLGIKERPLIPLSIIIKQKSVEL